MAAGFRRTASHGRTAALAVGGVLALAACSSGGGSAASGAPPSSAASTSASSSASASTPSGCAALAGLDGQVTDHGTGPVSGNTVGLTAGDFYFESTCLTASSGGKVSVSVTNSGTALHNFSVTSLGIDEDVAAGESITVDVTLPSTGTLPFQCKYHVASGMVGAFVVS